MGLLIVLASIFLLLKNDVKKLLYLFIFIVIAIPNNYNIKTSIGIIIFNFDFIYFPLILGFLVVLISIFVGKVRIPILKEDIGFLMFFLLIIIYSIVGFYNRNYFFAEDLKIYITLFMVFFLSRMVLSKGEDLLNILNIICIGALGYSLVVIYIYLFKSDQLYWIYGEMLGNWWGNRITFGNTSLLVISLILSIYFWLERKILHSIVTVTNIGAIYLSQNRTVIMMSLLVFVIGYIIYMLTNKNLKVFSKKIAFSTLLFFLLVVCTGIFIKNDIDFQDNIIIQRFLETDNLSVRKVSNEKAFDSLMDNPLGHGIGKEIVLYNIDTSIANTGLFIDNVFATIGVKFGILGIMIFSWLLVMTQLYIYKMYRLNNEKLYLLLIIIHPAFLIVTAYMNAQVIYSLPVMVFYVTFSSLISVKYKTYKK
ncbi:O-antigen ligase family protein [Bacillus cytotoxicus]|uniref:O-antigen ligase family protein n=1 Tax=Bacillus cytotoxicus TaxID=580165 RepID=UPI00244B98BF|nr:O-antigen ligase [Bacillus cytotoxicus]MDH2881564.1 oligosaccharide repeat unit polymerase [Bacillus cytotoxicus]